MSDPHRATMEYRDASLLLGLINVMQPVSITDIIEALGAENRDEVGVVLKFLVSRKLVRELPQDSYRTTWAGQQAIRSKVLRKNRDIQRMWRLSELSDNIRRSEEGDAS